MKKNLYATQKLTERMKKNEPLCHAYTDARPEDRKDNLLRWNLNYCLNAKKGRRAELLKNPAYTEILNLYR